MQVDLPIYKTVQELSLRLQNLAHKREISKKRNWKRIILSKGQRKIIYEKTSGRCHICWCILNNWFEADHVKNHTSWWLDTVDNFLPSCKTCNNYRRHYSSEELQWILKLGVRVKSQIIKNNKLWLEVWEKFIEYDIKREKRRKNPR